MADLNEILLVGLDQTIIHENDLDLDLLWIRIFRLDLETSDNSIDGQMFQDYAVSCR